MKMEQKKKGSYRDKKMKKEERETGKMMIRGQLDEGEMGVMRISVKREREMRGLCKGWGSGGTMLRGRRGNEGPM
jgi:hypothetical protein